jgi:hypothetical protein
MIMKRFIVVLLSFVVLHLFAALHGAALIVSCCSGATGSGTARPPTPLQLHRSPSSKRAEPPHPVDTGPNVVGRLAWPSPSRHLRYAFTTAYSLHPSTTIA